MFLVFFSSFFLFLTLRVLFPPVNISDMGAGLSVGCTVVESEVSRLRVKGV